MDNYIFVILHSMYFQSCYPIVIADYAYCIKLLDKVSYLYTVEFTVNIEETAIRRLASSRHLTVQAVTV